MQKIKRKENRTGGVILLNILIASISLFINGFGVYLTIQADIGAGPWDVLSLGMARTFGILYGTASVWVSYSILGIDIALKEPIGIAMFIDAFVVGKSVDLFNRIALIPKCDSLKTGIPVMILGLFIMAYTQYTYMSASLGCGPRDTLLVALTKRAGKIPIGAVSVLMLSVVTFIGWRLGGPVGIGTIICAFGAGPIMQLAFRTVGFNATQVHHQHVGESLKTLMDKHTLHWV
ncbi:MAG: hypothetical protein E7294_12505 [Lachnospiraceae bacterium]|nr:hypothetical protein [Lachnospiraceae bacterium]